MITAIQIEQMSIEEKLQTMEALWANLSRVAEDVESPDWHDNVLKETAARASAGQEQMLDWETAKRDLRKRFE